MRLPFKSAIPTNRSINNTLNDNTKLINDQFPHYIETSQLVLSANQLTSFYMMSTLVATRLVYRKKNLKWDQLFMEF